MGVFVHQHTDEVAVLGALALYVATASEIPGDYTVVLVLPLAALSFALLRGAYVVSRAARIAAIHGLLFVPILWIHTVWVGSTELTGSTVVEIVAWWALIAIAHTLATRFARTLQQIRDERRLGQYTLIERLGGGGMGMVFRARHELLHRHAAVKLIRPEKVGEGSTRRFEKEAQLTASLTHPNTVTIYDYGCTSEGVFYYAMEFLEGASLREVLALDGPQPPARVVEILMQVASALVEAHDIGLIHRDIKPENLFLTRQGGRWDVAKVLDFGLVKDLSEPDQCVTPDGALMGTPLYVAPEALTAPDQVDRRSDLYSLGAVAYNVLTGIPVFEAESVVEICAKHLHECPMPPSRFAPKIPAELDAIVLRCLQKNPEDRFDCARQLLNALEALDVPSWGASEANAWWSRTGAKLKTLRAATRQGHAVELGVQTTCPQLRTTLVAGRRSETDDDEGSGVLRVV